MDAHQKDKRMHNRGVWLLGLLLLGCWLIADSNPAQAQERSGFTLQLDFGAGLIEPTFSNMPHFGFSAGLGVGGFVTENLAILARANAVYIRWEEYEGRMAQFISVFFGVHAQYWICNSFFISGGPGAVFVAYEEVDGSGSNFSWGISLRTGYSFLTTTHHSLQVTLEFTNIDVHALMANLSLAWQFF
ncbi:MAG: hypothetical protein JRJ87_07475 [Deltaproteobacteria bacterium]|nr:hypothetical protein [Deltaproteobacteria bacterium]